MKIAPLEWQVERLKGLAISATGVLFDPITGNTFTLNKVAATIFKFLQEGQDLKAIHAALLERYEVNPLILERDIREFVNRMKGLELA